MTNKSFSTYVLLAKDTRSLKRALRVAIVVGVILNSINNPSIFFPSEWHSVSIVKVILTFIVPFCVSLYSSILANSHKE